MFTATLLIIAKTWEQSRWMNELRYIEIMKKPIKNDQPRKDNKYISLTERNQPKSTYCLTPTIWHSRKGKTMKNKRLVAARV